MHAPPTPCSSRDATSTGSVGDSAQASEATVNSARPKAVHPLQPQLSPSVAAGSRHTVTASW